jgi:hypothetical protein
VTVGYLAILPTNNGTRNLVTKSCSVFLQINQAHGAEFLTEKLTADQIVNKLSAICERRKFIPYSEEPKTGFHPDSDKLSPNPSPPVL